MRGAWKSYKASQAQKRSAEVSEKAVELKLRRLGDKRAFYEELYAQAEMFDEHIRRFHGGKSRGQIAEDEDEDEPLTIEVPPQQTAATPAAELPPSVQATILEHHRKNFRGFA